jgi:GNAT superfamily N-acetyltransferase
VIVRALTHADAGAAHALLVELGYEALDRAAFDAVLERLLAHSEMRAWVAEDVRQSTGGLVRVGQNTGDLLGLVTLSWRAQLRLGGTLATIDELVVTEGARGKGVGSALVRVARDHARSLGAVRVQLETNRARDVYRRRFYPKLGFTEVDRAVMRIEPA